MYLRRNKVRCGETRRTYLSIAHNVWWAGEGRKAQSRPVVIASFGVEDRVDVEVARDIVRAVELCAPRLSARRGSGKDATMRVAQEIRRIEPYLKALASRKLDLAHQLPASEERVMALTALIRDKLTEPDASVGVAHEDELVNRLRTQLGA